MDGWSEREAIVIGNSHSQNIKFSQEFLFSEVCFSIFLFFPQHVYWMVAMITIDLHRTRETLDLHHLSAEFRYKIAILTDVGNFGLV